MNNIQYSDNQEWRKFLKPLIPALVALLVAIAGYYKAHSETNAHEETTTERIAKLETKFENQKESYNYRIGKVERDAEILKASLSNIQSDVSFIRGKLENEKK